MITEPLSKHLQLIPEIAELRLKEFGYLLPDKTILDFRWGLESHLNDLYLPITYVVFGENKEFVGTFSLRKHDLDSHLHLSPWLGGVIVIPSKRNQRIGSFIIKKAESMALERGYSSLYLYTTNKETWYLKLGWKKLENAFFNNFPITIMLKELKY
jgi:predicted N-acetyltransferase YhbS